MSPRTSEKSVRHGCRPLVLRCQSLYFRFILGGEAPARRSSCCSTLRKGGRPMGRPYGETSFGRRRFLHRHTIHRSNDGADAKYGVPTGKRPSAAGVFSTAIPSTDPMTGRTPCMASLRGINLRLPAYPWGRHRYAFHRSTHGADAMYGVPTGNCPPVNRIKPRTFPPPSQHSIQARTPYRPTSPKYSSLNIAHISTSTYRPLL